jgi:hypothetical protein
MAFDIDVFLKESGSGVVENESQTEKPQSVQPKETAFDIDTFLKQNVTQEPISAPEESSGLLRQVADIPLKFAQGGISSAKSFTDLFGADNVMSKELAGYEKWVGSLVSAESKKDDEEIARILKDAQDKGVYDKVIAGLEAFAKAPLEMTAMSAGYMVPQLATGVLGKAAQFTKVGIIGTQAALGFAQGVGQAKGDIYQSTLEHLREQGVSEDKANSIATEAQSTLGKNLDQILLSGGLNAVASTRGAEAIFTRLLTKQGKQVTGGAIKGLLKGVAEESPLEAVQGLQQEVTKNVALQREGVDVPTFKGAIESATTGAVAGAFIGGPLGAFEAMSPEQKAEVEINKEANRKARDLEAPDIASQAIAAGITNLERGIDNKRKDLDLLESTSPEATKLRLDIAADQKLLAQAKEQANKLGLSETITEAERQQIELDKQIVEKPAEVTPQVTEVVAPITEVTPEVIAPVTEVTPTTEVVATTEVTPEVVTPDEIKTIEVTQEQIDTTAKEFGATPEGAKAIVENKPFESRQSQRLPDGWFTEAYEGKFFAIPPAIVKIRMPAQAELRKLSILERAALAGELSTEKIVNQTDATTYILEAKKQGFTTEEINAATPEARAKWNQRFGVAGNARTVAGEVSPPSIDFAAEEAERSRKPKITSGNVLPANKLFGKTAREALQYLADQNLGASELEREGRPLNTSQKMQRAASVIAKLPLRILDADFIKSGKGGNRAYRAHEGFIRIPATYRGQIYYEDPATLVHEVGHTLTADAVRKYVFDRAKMRASGSQYLRALDNSLSDQNTPEQIKKLISLYKKAIDELGLTNDYFGANGLASIDATSSQKKAFRRKKPIINKFTGKKIGWSELYALANLDEFVAQAWSSPSFQDLLKSIKVKNEPSIFEQFVRIIKDLFGFESDTMAAAVIDASFALAELEAPATTGTVEERIAENIAREKGKKAPKSPTQAEPTPTIKESLPVAPKAPAITPTPVAETPAITEAPIEPEAETITEAMAQGLDIGKEDNMPINNKIESHIKNFAVVRGFFESASDRLRRAGFKKLATAIDDYYDQAQRRLGFANKILLPAFDEYAKQSKANKKKIDEEVKMFYAAQENKRDTAEFFDELNPVTQKIVTAWQKFGEESGKDNQRIGIKVFDRGLQRYRPIGRIQKFFPRILKPEYKRALMEPDKYQKEYNEIVDALIKSGRIEKPEEAERYISNYEGTGTQQDYFSGIESARGQALPEELYDYSMQVMTDYVARWSQHASRIEQFGQKLGENSMTLWDRSRASTRDRRTIDYITAAQERVEGYFPNDPFQKGMAALNIWASGLQLGNPASATMNMVGGTTLNAMIGQPGAASSYVESLIELRKLGSNLKDAREKGIISRDLMNIVGDHQQVLDQNGIAKVGQKTADFLLKWSGFTPVEQMIRTQSLIIGKSFLRKTLSSFAQNPDSSFSKQASTWLSRNNFDIDKLLVEQGSGPETDKLMRYFATASQGGYTISQTPIFIDTPTGKFLFKYQKFSTQVMRQAWKNTFEPAWKAVTFKGETMQLPDETRQLLYRLRLAEAKEIGDNRKISLDEIPQKVSKAEAKALTLIPVMMWLASAYVGGEAILRLRDVLFGVMMKGPDYEDILKALEDDEDDDELYLGLQRAWYNLIGIGALGLIGNYGQFFMDWQDRERVKNPLDPPALSLLKETGTLITNVADQGTLTKGDINNYLNRMSSMYRVSQKLYQTSASGLGFSDAPTVAEEMYRREVADINKYARRWAESAGLEYRTKRPMDIAPSKMSPINREISSYLQKNDPVTAAAYAKEYLKTLPKEDRKNAIQSMESGARNRQPLRLGSGPMDEAEKRAFLKWAKTKMSPEKYAGIEKLAKQYESNRKKFLMRLPNR